MRHHYYHRVVSDRCCFCCFCCLHMLRYSFLEKELQTDVYGMQASICFNLLQFASKNECRHKQNHWVFSPCQPRTVTQVRQSFLTILHKCTAALFLCFNSFWKESEANWSRVKRGHNIAPMANIECISVRVYCCGEDNVQGKPFKRAEWGNFEETICCLDMKLNYPSWQILRESS